MIHNEVHQVLTDISAEQGWDEASQIQHLCGGFQALLDGLALAAECDKSPIHIWSNYLQKAVDMENEGVEAICEKCGWGFLSESGVMPLMNLCKNCKIEAAS